MVEQKRKKRFYKEVSVVPMEGGYSIALDGTTLKTPSSAVLFTNSLSLIEAITLEWKSQNEEIDFNNMPLFRLLATSIDRVAPNRGEINVLTVKFGTTDLLCYRAKEPEELRSRQDNAWQPLIEWAEETLGVQFFISDSLSPIKQPEETISAMENAVIKFSDIEVTAVSSIAAVTGSLITALALERGFISATLAFEISVLEELYQIERWGEDKVTTKKYKGIKQDIYEAYNLLDLVK